MDSTLGAGRKLSGPSRATTRRPSVCSPASMLSGPQAFVPGWARRASGTLNTFCNYISNHTIYVKYYSAYIIYIYNICAYYLCYNISI